MANYLIQPDGSNTCCDCPDRASPCDDCVQCGDPCWDPGNSNFLVSKIALSGTGSASCTFAGNPDCDPDMDPCCHHGDAAFTASGTVSAHETPPCDNAASIGTESTDETATCGVDCTGPLRLRMAATIELNGPLTQWKLRVDAEWHTFNCDGGNGTATGCDDVGVQLSTFTDFFDVDDHPSGTFNFSWGGSGVSFTATVVLCP